MLLRNCISGILLVVVINVNLTQGQVRRGPCENASRGQTFHKCTMECNFDGSCEEFVSSETCDCDGSAIFAGVSNGYQDGQGTVSVGKRRRKRQSDDVCNNMPSRCRSCRGGSGGSAQAVATENNKFCSGNGGSGNRRVINGGFNGGSNGGANGGSFGGSSNRNGGSGGCTRDTDCKGDRICDNQQCHSPGNGGSFGGNGGSFGGNNNGGSNGGSFGGGRSPSCGKKRVSGFTQGGCIYECDGDITGSGTCATESNGTCGSCFGSDWGNGGSCSGEPRQCTSCRSVCRNRGK